MSKEIARTVGGKKFAGLLAILALIAVFATVGSQWRSANAAFVASPTLTSNPNGGSVVVGSAVTFTATVAHDGGVLAAQPVTVSVPAGFDWTSSACAVTGSTAAINTLGAATNGGVGPFSVTCTIDVASAGTAGVVTLTIGAKVTGSGTLSGASLTSTPTAGPTPSFTTTAAVTLTKSNNPTTLPAIGGSVVSTITFSNVSGFSTGAAVTLTDTITTAGLTIPAGAPTQSGTSATTFTGCVSTGPAGWPGAAITTTASTTLSCTTSGVVLTGTTVIMPITMTVPATLTGQTVNDSASTNAVTVNGVTVTPAAAPATVAQAGIVNVELRHMSDTANIVVGGTGPGSASQDVVNNVRGSRHTVCAVQQNTGLDFNGDGDYVDAGEVAPVAVLIPGPLTLANIVITNGGGYASLVDTDPTFDDARIFVGDGSATGQPASGPAAGLAGATCFSWVSTDAGDQQLSIIYIDPGTGIQLTASWDTDGDANDNDGVLLDGVPNTALIKEWNRLENSVVTLSGATTGSTPAGTAGTVQNTSGTFNVPLVFNPGTGLFQGVGGTSIVSFSDAFWGSHTTRTGSVLRQTLAGVNYAVVVRAAGSSACGTLTPNAASVTTLLPSGLAGNPLLASFNVGGCQPGDVVILTFSGSEPSPIGSGTGVTVTQTVTLTFTAAPPPVKQVLLAWAGQRVILEHDWRLPPGDTTALAPAGSCVFGEGATITYIQSAGSPGNFVAGLGAVLNGGDQATVVISSNSQVFDATRSPQGSCISRVLYESEDPGEVDVEAFATVQNGQTQEAQFSETKVAFVVYYMKINTVNLSLVTQVSKPTHNSTGSDYSPGNPWDASKDAADNTADWNVSRDILVRGRVSGWFLNANPSGRARDDSNKQNVLPADRWVMPDDWVNIAGGSALAGLFRPSYDLMFAPNNARGIALTTPLGNAAVQISAVIAPTLGQAPNSTTQIRVSPTGDFAGLAAGTALVIGTQATTFTSISGSLLTVVAVTTVPAVGTPIFVVSGVPFEGPYSLIDIPGLAAQNGGIAGAALSNLGLTVATRDTVLDDGVIDFWDAPMPPANISVGIRGTGMIKQVLKQDVYYLGTANSILTQTYPNPYYVSNIPESPYISAVAAGGGWLWDSWGADGPNTVGCISSSFVPCSGGDGPYTFWVPAIIGANSAGIGDSFTTSQSNELTEIRRVYVDPTIARDLVVFSDNHGEFMVTANGDYRTDLTACAANALGGGKLCKPGDKVGVGTITAVADYPDFKKHFPVASNAATVNWTWGGYKDVTVEPGETDQFKYVVFHGLDRDGFCTNSTGAVLLHSLLTSLDATTNFGALATIPNANITAYAGDPNENIDFLIDSGEGIIIQRSDGAALDVVRQFATGVTTFSVLASDPLLGGPKEFPLSSLAASGATDECQAWIKVSNSLLGVLNVLVIAHNDEGNIGFDKIIDLTGTTSYTLNFRWSLITWAGADAIPVADALKGGAGTKNPGGNDISAQVTAVYGWEQASQTWLGFFPSGVNVPGANNLTALNTGQAYWIAITGPGPVTWTVTTNVS